jgi:hypothetical protein
MSESTDIELLHRAWEAMSGAGDLGVLEGALEPEAKWRGVEDGQICENRKTILMVMKRNLPGGFAGRIEETVEVGGRIVVAFRPDHPRNDGSIGSLHVATCRHVRGLGRPCCARALRLWKLYQGGEHSEGCTGNSKKKMNSTAKNRTQKPKNSKKNRNTTLKNRKNHRKN